MVVGPVPVAPAEVHPDLQGVRYSGEILWLTAAHLLRGKVGRGSVDGGDVDFCYAQELSLGQSGVKGCLKKRFLALVRFSLNSLTKLLNLLVC